MAAALLLALWLTVFHFVFKDFDMAFKRTQTPTFTVKKVVVNVPNDSGGFDKSTYDPIFRRINQDIKVVDGKPVKSERDELAVLSHEDLLRNVLVGWHMVDEDTKEDVPFSKAELEAAMLVHPFPMATALAFWESLNGVRSKNS